MFCQLRDSSAQWNCHDIHHDSYICCWWHQSTKPLYQHASLCQGSSTFPGHCWAVDLKLIYFGLKAVSYFYFPSVSLARSSGTQSSETTYSLSKRLCYPSLSSLLEWALSWPQLWRAFKALSVYHAFQCFLLFAFIIQIHGTPWHFLFLFQLYR